MVSKKMGVKMVAPSHAGAIWRERLGSALRTAMACTIIGCTALYGPDPVRHQIQYPSVAYVTAILIVSDATLGTTLRGSFYALCATILVLPSSILCLWAVGPSRFTEVSAAAAVTLSAFLVALPEFLPLLAKRIAFVQLVIIYVGAVVRGGSADAVTHPVHIAACTALGATASVLALILPYPRLAVTEVKKQFHLFTENASERSGLFMKAFLSEDKEIAYDLISRGEPMAESGTKLLDHINHIQEGVKWERYRMRDFKRSFVKMEDRLDDMETPIKGMELALDSIPSFPIDIVNPELKTVLQSERVHQTLKLDHAKCFVPFDEAVTVPERKDELFDKSLHTLTNAPPTHRNLPAFFFLSCFELLVNNSSMNPKPESESNPIDGQSVNKARESKVGQNMPQNSKQRIVFALKCSISLGFAVLLGMFFDKKNGYWSGLTIAISFVEGRQPVFTVANARVQGTAIGTVYGVLGSCLLNQVAEIRFIILLPWIVLTSLLQHSRMFGESGGISAVIGALLILGRKNYGPVKEFAIARITEVSIGLFCMVVLEVVLEPVRAATLVKRQVSKCLGTVDDCLNKIPSLNFVSVKENIKRLKSDIKELKSLSKDMKLEPSFWFLSFKGSCYDKVQKSLSTMVDLMRIMIHNMEFITSHDSDEGRKELQEHINRNLEMLKRNSSLRMKRLQSIMAVKSIEAFEHRFQEKEGFLDLESGSPIPVSTESTTKDIDAFLLHSKEVTDRIQGDEDQKEKTILHLNSLIFCVFKLMEETKEVERCIKEIIRWENPSRQIDFNELCYKIDVANRQ
ncbi:hypothetical protein L1887_23065 [Cichorium endivia]|nr:hypothetical protein L1887_23065 [Cichorium endivia]